MNKLLEDEIMKSFGIGLNKGEETEETIKKPTKKQKLNFIVYNTAVVITSIGLVLGAAKYLSWIGSYMQ